MKLVVYLFAYEGIYWYIYKPTNNYVYATIFQKNTANYLDDCVVCF